MKIGSGSDYQEANKFCYKIIIDKVAIYKYFSVETHNFLSDIRFGLTGPMVAQKKVRT